MNKSFFIVLLVVVTNTLGGYQAVQYHNAPTYNQLYVIDQTEEKSRKSEKSYRADLYWQARNNPLFYKLDEFHKDLDYYIAVLTEHIIVLEGKKLLRKNRLKSRAMLLGVIFSGMFCISGRGLYSCCERFRFKRSQILSPDFIIPVALPLGGLSILLAVASVKFFCKAYYCAERVVERLERDKKMLAILQQERATLENKKMNNASEVALAGLVDKLCQTVERALLPCSMGGGKTASAPMTEIL